MSTKFQHKSNAKRSMERAHAQNPTVNFTVDEAEGETSQVRFYVTAHLTTDTAHFENVFVEKGFAIMKDSKMTETVAAAHNGAMAAGQPASDATDAAALAAEAEAGKAQAKADKAAKAEADKAARDQRKATIAAEREATKAEREAKAAEVAAKKAADKVAKEAAKAAEAETAKAAREVAKAAKAAERAGKTTEEMAAKASEKAAAKAVREAEKAEAAEAKAKAKADREAAKAAKASEGPKPWPEQFAAAAVSVRAKLLDGKYPFKAGSQRDIANKLLEAGCTMEQAMARLGYNNSQASSVMYDVAFLTGRKIERVKAEGEATIHRYQ